MTTPTPEGDHPVLVFDGVSRSFRSGGIRTSRRRVVRAVAGVSLSIGTGEAVGLIGESGSGKSTLGRMALGLIRSEGGRVVFGGRDLAALGRRELRAARRDMHLIFQDPYESLSPRMRVDRLVAEPLRIHGVPANEHRARALEALAEADLTPAEQFGDRYPHELSGGQRQRVALARALVLRPRLIVADEPTSMLDVSLRAGLLATMERLRSRHGIAFLFITHDLAVAREFCDRIAVMFQGTVVETGPTETVLAAPQHPYTRALCDAVRGSAVPPVTEAGPTATGCVYRTRCPSAHDACTEPPALRVRGSQHAVACHLGDVKDTQ